MGTQDINWGSVADWVSGIGSLSAALAATWLGSQSFRIRLRGYCGIRTILGFGQPARDVLSISATNVGARGTIVNNVGMRVGGLLNRRIAAITMVSTPISAGIPVPLADGQSASWHIPLDANHTWVRDLCGSFVKTRADVRTLRFTVHTNHGRFLLIKPEESILKTLRAALPE